MTLRTRLVLGLVVLSALGLVAAGIATYASLRAYLYDQLDQSLTTDHIAAENQQFGHGCGRFFVAPEVFVRVTRDGTTCTQASSVPPNGDAGRDDGPPRSFDTRPDPKLTGNVSGNSRFFDAPAVSGSSSYRVRSEQERGAEVVVARPLDPLEDTLHRLLLIEVLVTAAVLAAIAVLGAWMIRRDLRPLEDMSHTADRIAAGDLTQRVEPADDRTEVGHLGLALNKMLGEIEASDQRLRRFVADASHELRTPLAAVRAYAELFGRGARQRPDDLERAMAGIGRESERMSLLVEDLLLLARLDEGRPLERRPVRLDEVAAEAVDAAHAVDPARPVSLDAEPSPVIGDRARLRQIFDNLLANVRAHTPAGSPARVHVAPANGKVVLEVADSGPGLDAEAARRVFERFYRADTSRSRASGGVGLGLSIVEAVAQAHHGTVSATSEPGQGTTFRIELPLSNGEV